jgi:hypothetical protein
MENDVADRNVPSILEGGGGCTSACLAKGKITSAGNRMPSPSGDSFIGVGDGGSIHAESNITLGYRSFIQAGDNAQVTTLHNLSSRQGVGDTSQSPQFPPPDGRYKVQSNSQLAQELTAIASKLSTDMPKPAEPEPASLM